MSVYIACMFLIISDELNISFIKYNTVFWFRSEHDPWKRLGVKGTFSEKTIKQKIKGALNKHNERTGANKAVFWPPIDRAQITYDCYFECDSQTPKTGFQLSDSFRRKHSFHNNILHGISSNSTDNSIFDPVTNLPQPPNLLKNSVDVWCIKYIKAMILGICPRIEIQYCIPPYNDHLEICQFKYMFLMFSLLKCLISSYSVIFQV